MTDTRFSKKTANIFLPIRVSVWMREYFWDRSEAVKSALAAAGVEVDYEYDE